MRIYLVWVAQEGVHRLYAVYTSSEKAAKIVDALEDGCSYEDVFVQESVALS